MTWCQLFSEPGAGPIWPGWPPRRPVPRAAGASPAEDLDHRRAVLRLGALLARTDPSAPKHNGITYFLLDMKSEGVQVKPLRELTGGAMFNTVFIDDVFVPDDCVLGEVNRGWEVSRNTLTAERVSIGSSEAPFLANLDEFVGFLRDGQFDQVAQNRGGQLIAEGHAAKVLNMRSTLLTLAGGTRCPRRRSPNCCRCVPLRVMPSSPCRRSAPTPRSATPRSWLASGPIPAG
ncbi:acyl-CoA dehydrogenase domain protein [Mycobacterium xenopi 3993]|nr:acyl-CoA dehydrogenase domain protein [Mycobacterium xenopi 3993]